MSTFNRLAEISLSEIEEKYGVKARMGEISVVKGKHYFKAGGKRWELNPANVVGPASLNKLALNGAAAGGIIIEGSLLTIFFYKPRKWILCYIPVPDLQRLIDPYVRRTLVNAFVKEKVITPQLGAQMLGEMKGWR